MASRLLLAVGLSLAVCLQVSDAGVSYIRWGRSTCPTGEIALYQGYMVNKHYQHRGGTSYLCADLQPQFVRGQAGHQDYAGDIYGVEFEIMAPFAGLFKTDNLNGGALHNQDALCVRCYIQDSSDVFVLPGRVDCHSSGYQLEYKGFLMAEINWPDHMATDYICVDEAPEGRVGGTGDDNQSVMYPQEFFCGSLPCNPYTSGMEATCAVCSY